MVVDNQGRVPGGVSRKDGPIEGTVATPPAAPASDVNWGGASNEAGGVARGDASRSGRTIDNLDDRKNPATSEAEQRDYGVEMPDYDDDIREKQAERAIDRPRAPPKK